MSDDSRLIFEAYIKESMPYPEFAKLSKHAASKLPKETAMEEPVYTHEKIAAMLPQDIGPGKEGENEILNKAAPILAKLVFDGNEKKASKMMYYDEDFNSDLVSTYRHYQKHGFPGVEKNAEEFKEQLPDSKEEYSAHDYAKEMEAKGEAEEDPITVTGDISDLGNGYSVKTEKERQPDDEWFDVDVLKNAEDNKYYLVTQIHKLREDGYIIRNLSGSTNPEHTQKIINILKKHGVDLPDVKKD